MCYIFRQLEKSIIGSINPKIRATCGNGREQFATLVVLKIKITHLITTKSFFYYKLGLD